MNAPLVTIGQMKKKNRVYFSGLKKALARRENLAWGLWGSLLWTFQVVRLHDSAVAFPFLFWLKGLALVLAAAAVYHLSLFGKDFSFLGMFPLLWLALSRCQWELCAGTDFHCVGWLVLFLLAEITILVCRDGRKLLGLLTPLWIWLAWLSPVSLLLPLGFLTAPGARFKNASWARWGGAVVATVLFLLLKGWRSLGFDGLGLLDFLAANRFVVFFLLGWLGLAAFPAKGTYRYAATPLFFLMMGFVFWPTEGLAPNLREMLEWVLIFFAGFGWESFRRDLMDDTWHGRALWFAMGLGLLGGVV